MSIHDQSLGFFMLFPSQPYCFKSSRPQNINPGIKNTVKTPARNNLRGKLPIHHIIQAALRIKPLSTYSLGYFPESLRQTIKLIWCGCYQFSVHIYNNGGKLRTHEAHSLHSRVSAYYCYIPLYLA